jgi:hypothetical protein
MPSKTKPPATSRRDADKTQRERFIEAAHEVGVDETGKEFERALDKITPSRDNSKGPRRVSK